MLGTSGIAARKEVELRVLLPLLHNVVWEGDRVMLLPGLVKMIACLANIEPYPFPERT